MTSKDWNTQEFVPKKLGPELNLKEKFDKGENSLLYRKNINKGVEVDIFLYYFGKSE